MSFCRRPSPFSAVLCFVSACFATKGYSVKSTVHSPSFTPDASKPHSTALNSTNALTSSAQYCTVKSLSNHVVSIQLSGAIETPSPYSLTTVFYNCRCHLSPPPFVHSKTTKSLHLLSLLYTRPTTLPINIHN